MAPGSGLKIVDAPAYATRGYLLDAGRKWYSPAFLKDLCTYASFFKISEFHYHTSDNYPLNRGHNGTWQDVYAQFSLRPEKDAEMLKGLVQRENETMSRVEFEDLQSHCVRRGITIIPEIEAPGHCLSITKWKPELALPTKKDLLNLTHPESIPTVQRIWREFLPWFQTKEVHIGADEYDSELADDYIRFVNEMERFVRTTADKGVRIWGTHEPSENLTISKNVVVQHWQYGQSDPVDLGHEGYQVINSEDWWAYVSLKNDHMPILPAPYAQFFNESKVYNFAGRGEWQWQPSLFNPVNATEQLPPASSQNKGAILAAWNDNGYDATTQLEAFYSIRRGIPLVASRAWSGARGPLLVQKTWSDSVELFSSRAPSQNLDRNIKNTGLGVDHAGDRLCWLRPRERKDDNSTRFTLGLGSKGPNYTMTLLVTGPFNLSSADATLTLSDGGSLVFISDGTPYPLRSVSPTAGFDAGHPGRIWSNDTTSTHDVVHLPMAHNQMQVTVTSDYIGGSRVWVDGLFAGRFEVFVFGGRNTLFSWSQMAFVAPLDTVEGGIDSIRVGNDVHPPSSQA
ncbi:glycoside hydrolase superfamily [Microdochium bolleyi]|uniref:beta-N-acetylhexosaminidase n=1 Tax=Microdochium bolleyi TaxID=196109 RepID=A0A136IN66_9PEZI|nr:glycoside hydrolase superfamily [Microdochium bolleyi]